MSRKSMINIETVVSLDEKHGCNLPFDSLEHMAVMYEEGINKVLQEIARKHLRVCDGFEVERSEKHKCQSDKKEQIFDLLISKVRDEKSKALLRDFATESNYLSLIEMDGAYIEGFLAGYRFLKELHPD